MAMSGVKVSDEVVNEFKDMKLKTNATKIIYCEIDDKAEKIIVKKTSGHFVPAKDDTKEAKAKRSTIKPENPDDDHEGKYISFTDDFTKNYKLQPAYVIYDFHYVQSNGQKGEKVILISWIPEDAQVKKKMIYASTKEALSKKLEGIALAYQANDETDLMYEDIKKALAKNK